MNAINHELPNLRPAECCATCKHQKISYVAAAFHCLKHNRFINADRMVCDDYSPEGEGEGE